MSKDGAVEAQILQADVTVELFIIVMFGNSLYSQAGQSETKGFRFSIPQQDGR